MAEVYTMDSLFVVVCYSYYGAPQVVYGPCVERADAETFVAGHPDRAMTVMDIDDFVSEALSYNPESEREC